MATDYWARRAIASSCMPALGRRAGGRAGLRAGAGLTRLGSMIARRRLLGPTLRVR